VPMAWIRDGKVLSVSLSLPAGATADVGALHPASGLPLSSDRRDRFPFGVSHSIGACGKRDVASDSPNHYTVRFVRAHGSSKYETGCTLVVPHVDLYCRSWLEALYKKGFPLSAFLGG
jgi:hypothetical protein